MLKKQPVPGNLIDEDTGRPITFQCPDCTDREPVVLPQVHPNGELVNHVYISDLKDADEGEQTTSFGDYDNREQQAAMNQQSVKDHEAEIVNLPLELDSEKSDDTSYQEDRQETHTQNQEQTE